MKDWAASCSRLRVPACLALWSSCLCRLATSCSSSDFRALSTGCEIPTPTRMPTISARKTAASEATWYRRSNISELRGSLAQRMQPVERIARQRSPQPNEEGPADGEHGVGAVRGCARELDLHVEAFADQLPLGPVRRLDRDHDQGACHVGASDEAGLVAAVERPARS